MVGLLFFADRLLERQPFGTIIGCTTKESLVALTFDDGPHAEYTPRLLDILARHGIHATFFVIGEQGRKHPEILRRMIAEGHTIANHTWDHPRMPGLSASEQKRQIRACAAEIKQYGGPLIFRPPWGAQNPALITRVHLMGYLNVTWSMDADDWADHDSAWFAETIQHDVRPGTIILLHDRLTPPAEPAAFDRTNLLNGLDIALEQMTKRYHFVTVPQLLTLGKPITRRLTSNRLNRLYESTG